MIDSLLADPGLEGHQVPMNTPMDTNARRTQLPASHGAGRTSGRAAVSARHSHFPRAPSLAESRRPARVSPLEWWGLGEGVS